MTKYYITPSLLNSWQYNIKNGTLEDFIKINNHYSAYDFSKSMLSYWRL